MDWLCVKCGESIGKQFDACWNCGTSREGQRCRSFRHADWIAPESLVDEEPEMAASPRPGIRYDVRTLFRVTFVVALISSLGVVAWMFVAAWASAMVLAILLTGAFIHFVYGLSDAIRRTWRRRR